MGRGRPPVHKTKEAKLEANRAKSKRYYAKCKDKINRRKCERRRELDPELALAKPLPPLLPKPKTPSGASRARPAEFWLKLAEKVPEHFKELMGNRSAPQFLTYVAHDFEVQHRNSEPEEQCRANIEHYIDEIGKLQAKLSRYFDRLLNAVGLGRETSRINEIAADIRRVELSLQDFLVDIFENSDAVARQVRHGRLTFA